MSRTCVGGEIHGHIWVCIIGKGYSIIKDECRFSLAGEGQRGGGNEGTDPTGTEGLDWRVEGDKTRPV